MGNPPTHVLQKLRIYYSTLKIMRGCFRANSSVTPGAAKHSSSIYKKGEEVLFTELFSLFQASNRNQMKTPAIIHPRTYFFFKLKVQYLYLGNEGHARLVIKLVSREIST